MTLAYCISTPAMTDAAVIFNTHQRSSRFVALFCFNFFPLRFRLNWPQEAIHHGTIESPKRCQLWTVQPRLHFSLWCISHVGLVWISRLTKRIQKTSLNIFDAFKMARFLRCFTFTLCWSLLNSSALPSRRLYGPGGSNSTDPHLSGGIVLFSMRPFSATAVLYMCFDSPMCKPQAVELEFSIRYSWRLHIFVHRSCSFQHLSTRHDAQVVPRHSLPARVQEQPSLCWRSFGQRLCFAGRWWSVSWTLGASWGLGGRLQLEKIY